MILFQNWQTCSNEQLNDLKGIYCLAVITETITSFKIGSNCTVEALANEVSPTDGVYGRQKAVLEGLQKTSCKNVFFAKRILMGSVATPFNLSIPQTRTL